MPLEEAAWITRYGLSEEEDHYGQAGDLYRLMDDAQKNHLTATIAEGLVQASASVQQRMLLQFRKADKDYAARIKAAMESLQ